MDCRPLAREKAQSQASVMTFGPRTVVVASLVAYLALAVLGSLGDICLGDEAPHVRHVRAYARTGQRVPYDPLFPLSRQKAVPFSGTPLWHAGLAALWRITGTESQTLSQFYHAGFYVLLVLSVYFLGRRIWGPPEGSWAWLMAATTPMVCVYSLVLYQDVPGVAVLALALLLLWRKNFFWCGVALAAAYMTKMNMLSYAPWAVAFAAWWSGGTWRRRLVSAALVAAPVVVVFGGDVAWRYSVYGNMMGQSLERMPDIPVIAAAALGSVPANSRLWKPYAVTQPEAVASHLGIALLAGGALAVLRAWDVRCGWLWACLGVAIAGFICIFVPAGSLQVRYLFPAVLVLILLGARALARWRVSPRLRAFIVAGCILQAVAASLYMYHKRRISPWERAGYAWIRLNTPKDVRIMFPEQILTNETGRPFMWGVLNPPYFMTEATDEQRVALLEYFSVTHIAVSRRRMYDRHKEGNHAGGYARDFVDKLPTLPYLKKVYENPGFILFEFVPLGGGLESGRSGGGDAEDRAPRRLTAAS